MRPRQLSLAIGVSIALHAIVLGGAHLVLAGTPHVDQTREDAVVFRLDLRRAGNDTRRTEYARAPEPIRRHIPQPIELEFEPLERLDRDDWPAAATHDELESEPRTWTEPARTGAGRGSARAAHGLRQRVGVQRVANSNTTGAGAPGANAHGLATEAAADAAGGTGLGTAAVVEPDHPPRAIDTPRPEYPAASRRRGDQGVVACRIHVSARGDVVLVEVLASSGSARLDRAAVETLERWRYEPARRGGSAVAEAIDQDVRFALEGPESAGMQAPTRRPLCAIALQGSVAVASISTSAPSSSRSATSTSDIAG